MRIRSFSGFRIQAQSFSSVKNVFDSICNLLFRVIAIPGYICYSMEKEEEFRLVS